MNLQQIYRLSQPKALIELERIRWPDGIRCPKCGHDKLYPLKARERHKCAACYHQFSVTSATVFSSLKLPRRDLLAAAFVFVRSAKGISSVQLASTIGMEQRTAWTVLERFRRVLAKEVESLTLKGVIEIDGATFGGHKRLTNVGLRGWHSEKNVVRRYGKRAVIVIAHQRLGRTVPIVVSKESEAKQRLVQIVENDSVIVADGARAWDSLADLYSMLRLQHAWSFMAANGACTNNAESYFSGMRKMHDGTHQHMSAHHLQGYASELAWKRDCKAMRISHDKMMVHLLHRCLQVEGCDA